MNVLDLFSGIGGFSLGLERAGMRTVAFCEVDPFCRRVLKKHWPDTPIFHDVRELSAQHLTARGIAVDAICGGFPCQDLSLLGKGQGLEGSRSGLWFEYARLIGELRPTHVIVENVPALLHRGIGRVLGDLAAFGFDAEWHCIPAAAIGGVHERDRVWIIAHPPQRPLRAGWFAGSQDRKEDDWTRLVSTGGSRSDYEIPDWLDRVGACGNAVIPDIPEIIGRAIMNVAATIKPTEREGT